MSIDELMRNAGEKIVAIESKITDFAPVILNELESPYYMNKKIPHYRQEREIYRLISCDKQISQEFQSLKNEMSRMIRRGWEGKANQLAKDFAANLSETYFQNKGIDLAFDEIQEMFYQHLYAQCILDM